MSLSAIIDFIQNFSKHAFTIHLIGTMRPNQSHPLQTCITQAALHIAASYPSMQGLHPTILQVAWPTE